MKYRIVVNNSYIAWEKNTYWHRGYGPAYDGYYDRKWYKEGYLHRKYGPALEDKNGLTEYWSEGKFYFIDNL